MPSDKLTLAATFGLTPGTQVICLVGGGGKTTLMYALARELAGSGARVISTTTTKIFPPTPDQSAYLELVDDDQSVSRIERRLASFGHVTVGGSLNAAGKVTGVREETLRRLSRSADHIIVEADGAGRRPVKAPEPWEPVIPADADVVIPVVGLDCLGRPADEIKVFRLERFLSVTGLNAGDVIDPEAIARLLVSPDGAFRAVPSGAKVIPYLNKIDLLDMDAGVESIANLALQWSGSQMDRVVAGSLAGAPRLIVYRR